MLRKDWNDWPADVPARPAFNENGDDRWSYTEPPDVDDPGTVDFTIHRGYVEITTAGSPLVPIDVLRRLVDIAEARRQDDGGW